MEEIKIPPEFNWRRWADRWDRMQERYLVGRTQRFDIIVRIIRATQPVVSRILDLGCGPGSLTLQLLEAFPQVQVEGIDFDPLLLLLGKARLMHFGNRAKLRMADLRTASWPESLRVPFDAVVSATALHWLTQEQSAALYRQIAQILRPGGIFLNADHAASDYLPIQTAIEKHHEEMQLLDANVAADDWRGFWEAYGRALGVDVGEIHQQLGIAGGRGVEKGLPLTWHFDSLRASGFAHVDCFWRTDGDAVYGGMLRDKLD